jgi:hypothetical protein
MNAIAPHERGVTRPIIVVLLAVLTLAATIAPASAAEPTTADDLTKETVAPERGVELVESTTMAPAGPSEPAELTTPPPDPGPVPGPGLNDDIEVAPTPQTSLTLTPSCDPAGFDFQLTMPLPAGGTKILQWRPAGGAPTTAFITTGTGSVASGEGKFQARGVGMHPAGGLVAVTAWVPVTVECERPNVTIDVLPTCDPDGLHYEIDVDHAPAGPVAYKAQWRALGGGVHVVDGQTGEIPTGEGAFEIRGVLHDQGPGMHVSEWVRAVVGCPDQPVDPRDPDDDIRPGVPTFTG